MTPCDTCSRPALIRQGEALYCEVCYAVTQRDAYQEIADAADYRSAEWREAKQKIGNLTVLIHELTRIYRARRRVA